MHPKAAEEDPSRIGPNGKRRRLQGSCDPCRRKKVRCDSAEMPGNRCSNCIQFKLECTHNRVKAPEPPADETEPPSAQTLKPAKDLVAEILSTSAIYIPSNDLHTAHQILVAVALYARNLEEKVASLERQTPFSRAASVGVAETSDSADTLLAEPEEFFTKDPVTGSITFPSKKATHFYGKSSSVSFTQTAMKQLQGNRNPEIHVGLRRPQFWTVQPWKRLILEAPSHTFPEEDLFPKLVKIYFDQINPLLGVLHLPSFHQSLADGLHLRDPHFGAVVLVVCALGSRYSDDPRVFLPPDELHSSYDEHSCGWKYFNQVRPLRTSFSPEPSLYTIQLLCLSALYLAGTAAPEESWIYTALGVRFAQGAGAHHRSGYARMQPLEGELHRRVFWTLAAADTIKSSFRGRPSITTMTELDVDLPSDADAEFWGVSNAVQPQGKPSSSAFVPVYLKLLMIFEQIQGAVRLSPLPLSKSANPDTQYPVDGKPSNPEVIAELDSDLNEWVDGVPEHLRWDPHQENQVFLDQSAALYTTYYHAQIMIHRPFIPAPGKEPSSISSISFPSLAICANAARACGHVLDVQTRRGRGLLFLPNAITALFDSAVVLLINVWSIVGGRNSPRDFDRATADVQNCVRVLHLYERRWRVAGRKVDVLTAMLNTGKHAASGPSLKRPRDAHESTPPSITASQHFPETDTPDTRPIAGSSRVLSATQQIQALQLSIRETDHLFSLPLHTEELGSLPIYNDSFGYEGGTEADNLQYQPQSHWNCQMAALVEPESVYYSVDQDHALSDMGPISHIEDNGFAGSGGEHLQIPSSASFEIPAGDGWGDWSAYLANVDGLTSGMY
ncbi:fungal-specific transcription factor domain-containing protein [Mycena crocata]|nr:fungal-specific transcription factor domain-containing protein [Mycena crocata]